MSNDPVVVYTAAGHLQAEMIRGLLEAAGIRAEVLQEGVGEVYGLTVGPMGEAQVLVAAADAEAARALLASMEQGELEPTSDEDGGEAKTGTGTGTDADEEPG